MPIVAAGTHNFTEAFIEADENSYVKCEPIDNSSDGAITGVKYKLKNYSVLEFGYGANALNIPGDLDGVIDNSQVIGRT